MKGMLGMALAVALLGACAQPMMKAPDAAARPGEDRPPVKCRVNVHVTGEGHVVIDHEPVRPRGCDDGAAVRWHLRTEGYRFDAARGVAFDKGATPAARCGAGPNDRIYICRFGLERRGTFPYSIHVVGPSGPRSVDPSVIVD